MKNGLPPYCFCFQIPRNFYLVLKVWLKLNDDCPTWVVDFFESCFELTNSMNRECLNVATFDIFSSKYGEFFFKSQKILCKVGNLSFCHQVAKFCKNQNLFITMGFNMKKNRATKLKANKGFSVVLFKTLK
jgi:hypothetical protein